MLTEEEINAAFKENWRSLHHYAFLRLKDFHMAEDVVQSAFEDLVKKAPIWKHEGKPFSWLRKNVEWKINHRFRDNNLRAEREASAAQRIMAWIPWPSNMMEAALLQHAIETSMSLMTPAEREAFQLYQLDKSKGTPSYYNGLSRARARIRSVLNEKMKCY